MALDQKEKELRSLFSKWIENEADENTIRDLSMLAEDEELTETWQQLLADMPDNMSIESIEQEHAAIFDKVYQNLLATEEGLMVQAPVRRMRTWLKYAVAAAVLFIFLAGGFYLFNTTTKQNTDDQVSQTTQEEPVNKPDNNKAILTLGSGKQIILDSTGNGMLAQQSGAAVIKSANGRIEYQQNDSLTAANRPVDFNTVSTPKAGEYIITLPDGTIAWLNAASSITFPTAFRGADRTVSVQGEVYLQVAKKASQPFRVKVKEAIIDVLGTGFNVNAYADEPVTRITLLEGSISLTKGNERKLLKPGQQLWFRENSDLLTLNKTVDTEQVIAWKNGTFDFRDQDFDMVMKQIERWYNMEIKYEGKIPDVKILGIMSRDTPLATLLHSIELTTGIRFKIDNNTSGKKPGKIFVHL